MKLFPNINCHYNKGKGFDKMNKPFLLSVSMEINDRGLHLGTDTLGQSKVL